MHILYDEGQMEKKNYFEKVMMLPEGQLSLAEAALHIGKDESPKLKISSYVHQLDGWATEIGKNHSGSPGHVLVDRINDLLFGQMKFSGNLGNYYDPKNSYLNEVMDRRTGIPISLSVIYLELAWRLGLDAAGVGFPGHFLVRVAAEGRPLYI